MHWLICCIKNSKTLGIVVPEGKEKWYFASASFPCKGLVCHIFDMRIPWFWKRIWHGSISGNICLIEVSNPAKFDAFIKKRTILSLNSWTTYGAPSVWRAICSKITFRHITTYYDTCICRKDMKQVEIGRNGSK